MTHPHKLPTLLRSGIALWLLLAACTAQPGPPTGYPTPTLGGDPASGTPSVITTAGLNDAPATTPATLTTAQAGSTPTTTPAAETPPATAPAQGTRPQYTLTATLDYAAHQLSAEEQITYTNNTGEALADLALIIDALYFPDTFHLTSLTLGEGRTAAQIDWQGGSARIRLPQPLMPGETAVLSIQYALSLPSPVPSPDVRPIPFGYTPRQTNLVDWYPYVAPYRPGEGWLVHPAGFYGEHLVYEKSDFQVNLRLADDRPEMVIAAAAPAVRDGPWHRYLHTNARNFSWSASHQYQVSSVDMGGVTVLSYYFPYHAQPGEVVLKVTADAVGVFSELYGPYPHPTLSVVEADFLDGMEYDGLYFLSNGFYNLYHGSPAEYLVAIAAHETAHQWFYGLVGNDQALEPWLDEALCTYNEKVYYEHYAPEALDWWWKYRIQYFQPAGWVDSSIYDTQGYASYRAAVYFNGAVFLDELRGLLGEEQFFVFLRSYTSRTEGRIATADDFFNLLPAESTEISALVDRYFSSH